MRLAVLTLTLALAATAAGAQPIEELTPRREVEEDREVRAAVRNLFISPMGEPFRGGQGLAAWFAKADGDGDGKITPAEFQADAERYFKVLDTSKDGKLDGFELQAWERDHAPEIGGVYTQGGLRLAGPPPERGGGLFGFGRKSAARGREGAGQFGLLNIPQPVQGSDRDADRRVSLDEWKRTASVRFDLLDTGKSGALTLATLPPLPGTPGPPKAR